MDKLGEEPHIEASGLFLLPPAPDVCQECAVKHAPADPHNRDSLYYQYHFYAEHHRWPTWEDAMSHCSEEVKEVWHRELKKLGIG